MTGGRRSTSLSQQTDGGEPPSKLDALLQDNETLRAMLRRAWGTTTTRNEESIASSTHHLQATLDKKEEALKQERDKRAMAESLVAELRHDREMSLRAKDTEIRKLQDAVTHLKAENTVLHRRAQEDQQVVSILKKENQRLLEQALQKSPLHGKGNVSARSGSHAYSPDYATKVRSERIRADVPSIKNVGGVSPAAYTKTLVSSGVRSAEKPRTLLTGRAVSPATSVSGGRASVSHRSTSHVARNLTFEVGQRCTWHRMQGVVRYMGPVHGVGDEVVGVELLFRGSGDHDGTFNGVTYFRAPPRSAVFCQLSELQAPNDSRPSTPTAGRKTPRMVVSPPQAALHVTSNHWSLQRDDTNACLSEVEYEVYEPSTDISPNQPAFVPTDADVRRGLDLVLDAEAVDQLVKVTTTDLVPSHHNTTTDVVPPHHNTTTDVVPSHHNTCDDTQARASTNTSDGATAVVDTSSMEVCIRKDDAVNELIGDSPAGPSTDASPQRDVPTTSSSDVLGDASN